VRGDLVPGVNNNEEGSERKKISVGIGEFHARLKDYTARINDRNKHKVTKQMNHKTADPKVNATVFLFFPNAQIYSQSK
jgi:hypothetical protein